MFFDAKKLRIVEAKKKHAYALTVLTRRFFPYVNFSFETITERLATNSVKYLVAEYDGHTVGFADVEFTEAGQANISTTFHHEQSKEKIAKILGLAVVPEFQGQGIGTMLLKKLLSKAKKKASKAFMLVAEDNHGAQQIYYDNGFEKQGILERELGGKKILLLKREFS